MGLSVRILAPKIDDDTVELCGHALASTNPPLSRASVDRITEIEANRMGQLQGGDLFQATKFFKLLRGLPPIEGPSAAAFLGLQARTDFSLESAVRVLEDPSLQANVGEEPKIYRGFQSMDAQVVGQEGGIEITFDVDKSVRDGMKTVAQMFITLSAISDPQLRVDLIEDCKKIVEIRFEFDLSK
jgi:hypothetical protein